MMSSEFFATKCSDSLQEWRKNLFLTSLEKNQLAGEIKALDRQFKRLSTKHIRITVFGRVGVGKSSLLNALLGKNCFATNIANGFTRKTKGMIWENELNNLNTIELVDTPGIDEIKEYARARLASRVALFSDLILLVLNSDITSTEIDALEKLLQSGKPVLIVLNKCDQWDGNQIQAMVKSIRRRLPSFSRNLIIESVSAAPRKAKLLSNKKVRSEKSVPKVECLRETLLNLLEEHGNTLLLLNALRQAEAFYTAIKTGRLERRKLKAQGIIGKFAALKASGVAINPLLIFDFATGIALDTALIVQLSKVYGLELKRDSATELLKKLSLHNGLLGGAQLGIQFLLGIVKHLLFLASPFTGGLSLAPTAPVALAQAAVAVHTTKLTGRLAAEELLLNSYSPGVNPRSMLQHFYNVNPQARQYLSTWRIKSPLKQQNYQTFLP